MRFEIAADTDRGIVKETNQDSLLVKCFSTCKGDMAFAVLCDGMGGLSKGELASATVVRAFDRWSDEQLPELCKSSNPDIDSLILERQSTCSKHGNNSGSAACHAKSLLHYKRGRFQNI